MKVLKWVAIVAAVYIGFVVVFEAVIMGMIQPELEGAALPMLVITTTDDSGGSEVRRLAQLEVDGRTYVSAHHWPRGWYHRAVANPEVRVEVDGVDSDYFAVPVEGAEFDRVAAEVPLPFTVRFVMGFPPERNILRLDPAP